jgi:hypothetical protein
MNQNSKILVEKASFFFKTNFVSSQKYIKCDGKLLTINMSVQYSTTNVCYPLFTTKRGPKAPFQVVCSICKICAWLTSSFYQIGLFCSHRCKPALAQCHLTLSQHPILPLHRSFITFCLPCFFLILCPIYSSKSWITYSVS